MHAKCMPAVSLAVHAVDSQNKDVGDQSAAPEPKRLILPSCVSGRLPPQSLHHREHAGGHAAHGMRAAQGAAACRRVR